ncbi:F0F1 ATP synthase subunit delta [Methylomonas sp. MgM2]
MQFDWTTFFLEIINFLVLLWILQRFIYRPILDSLDARQQRIKDESAHAEGLRHEAELLRRQYEARLSDWDRECELNRHQLEQELAKLRTAGLENLKKTLADEEAKARIRNEAAVSAHEAALRREATGAAYRQVSAMLQRLASAELTHRIVGIFLDDLGDLPETDQQALRKAAATLISASAVEIVSAHPLADIDRNTLVQALSAAAGQALNFTFSEDPRLIAGIRAIVGECQLHANLADELAFFRRDALHG